MNKFDVQLYKDENKLTLEDVLILYPNPTPVSLSLSNCFFHLILSIIQGLSFTIHVYIYIYRYVCLYILHINIYLYAYIQPDKIIKFKRKKTENE